MNNPENHTPERAPHEKSTADYFIEHCVNSATTRRSARAIQTLYEVNGTPFAAYLSLKDIDPNSESLKDDYENAFVATYPDEDALIESELASLGWIEAIDTVIRQQTIPEGVLEWNYDAFLEHLRRYMYDIVDLGGAIHAFAK